MQVEFSAKFRLKARQYVKLLDEEVLPTFKHLAEESEPRYNEEARREFQQHLLEDMDAEIEAASASQPQDANANEPSMPKEESATGHSPGILHMLAERIRDILHRIHTNDTTLLADPVHLFHELNALTSLSKQIYASSAYMKDHLQGLNEWIANDKELAQIHWEAEVRRKELRILRNNKSGTNVGFGLSEAAQAEANEIYNLLEKKAEEYSQVVPPNFPDEVLAYREYLSQRECIEGLRSHFALMALDYRSSGDEIAGNIRKMFAESHHMAESYHFSTCLDFVTKHEDTLRRAERHADETIESDLRLLRREQRGRNKGQGEGRS